MVEVTLGWSTYTCWKRRSSAGSFSMYLRYSSSVVAPMHRSSPRPSMGFSRLPEHKPELVCTTKMVILVTCIKAGSNHDFCKHSTHLHKHIKRTEVWAPLGGRKGAGEPSGG